MSLLNKMSIEASTLSRYIRAVAPAGRGAGTRVWERCMEMSVDTGVLSIVATDSYRLHVVQAAAIGAADFSVTVDTEWLLNWAAGAKGMNGSCYVFMGDDYDGEERLSLKQEEREASVRTHRTELPNWRFFLGTEQEKTDELATNFNATYLADAMRSLADFAPNKPTHITALNLHKPCVFSVEDGIGATLRVVLMPLRVA